MNFLHNLDKYRICLCSGSPRRKELLTMAGVPYTLLSGIEVDETIPIGVEPERVPEILAMRKAEAYKTIACDNDLLITADTVVILDDKILGKPVDEADAKAMLHNLSGKTHHVVTGVVVMTKNRVESFSTKSAVTFAPLNDDEITRYVEVYKPLDKAGAYGIQEWIGAIGVSAIDGSFYNVMGLPVQRLYTLLRDF